MVLLQDPGVSTHTERLAMSLLEIGTVQLSEELQGAADALGVVLAGDILEMLRADRYLICASHLVVNEALRDQASADSVARELEKLEEFDVPEGIRVSVVFELVDLATFTWKMHVDKIITYI